MHTNKAKYVVAISVATLAVVSSVALTKPSRTMRPPVASSQEKQQTVDTLPLIISQVAGIEVVKASLKNKGKQDVCASLEIKNVSDKGVVAVSVEIGKPEEAEGITTSGFKEGDEPPSVVIEPNKSITVELPLNNAKPGDPIRVSGVIYADGSEEGDIIALETIHAQREHSKSIEVKKSPSQKKKIERASSPL